MDVLQNVRLAEEEWARRFSGRREAPRLGLGQWQFRVSRGLNRFACAIEGRAYVAACTVDAALARLIPSDVYKTRHRSRVLSRSSGDQATLTMRATRVCSNKSLP